MSKANPEDLLRTVVAADDLRRKSAGLPSTRAARALSRQGASFERRFTEPVFNVLGHAWAFVMMALPSFVRRPFIQWVNRKMSGRVLAENVQLPSRIVETVSLAQEIKAKTGSWPVLLVLTSHPNTEGPHQWLRFELLRQGLLIADAVVEAQNPGAWYPRHPRCFLAIDPYALDTVSSAVGGFYAAWMHRIYIAWDRLPSTQSWIQRHWLLRGSDYSRIAWRLLRTLKARSPVLMVLSGGLPYNARLLYAAREFVQRLPIAQWKIPKKQARLVIMRILMKPVGTIWPAENGELPQPTRQAIGFAMQSWGLPESQVNPALEDFEKEFKLAIPYRTRLFRVLMKRLVARGTPLILLPISHQDDPTTVKIASPISVVTVPENLEAFAQQIATTQFSI